MPSAAAVAGMGRGRDPVDLCGAGVRGQPSFTVHQRQGAICTATCPELNRPAAGAERLPQSAPASCVHVFDRLAGVRQLLWRPGPRLHPFSRASRRPRRTRFASTTAHCRRRRFWRCGRLTCPTPTAGRPLRGSTRTPPHPARAPPRPADRAVWPSACQATPMHRTLAARCSHAPRADCGKAVWRARPVPPARPTPTAPGNANPAQPV